MDIKKNKEEFIELLRSTGRNGVDDTIESLDEMGFFTAPASAGHHLNTEGGLVLHSLNTCRAALAVWEGMKILEPSIAGEVGRDSIIIASLLHDVCKADIYVRSVKKQLSITSRAGTAKRKFGMRFPLSLGSLIV